VLQKDAPDFGLCLTSLHTYDANAAYIITSALNARFGMSRRKRMHIMTCLQEALANAVIHGNLCIECDRNSLAAFERYYQLINDRIMQPAFASTRVYVRAWSSQDSFRICITHGGNGSLGPDILHESRPALEKRAGRGLFIIQSLAEWVTTDAERKSIDITFTY